MSLFLNSKFINFREFATRKYDLFSLAKDRQTGEIFITGNSQLALDHLKNMEKVKQRSSREWLPRAPQPDLPMPFAELVGAPAKLRQFSSLLLHHFLQSKLKLGRINF